MSYTDSQMIVASQIAYMDFGVDVKDGGPFTVMELLEMEKQGADEKRVADIQKLIDLIHNTPGCQVCGEWVIKDICNDQHGSGMYACMIDTRDGEAMIAFRGSESDTWENKIKDWGLSDFGLLNGVLTPQQAAAERYIRELYRNYGDQYNGFGVTGHSLGGNLAEHAVITAPDGMRDKIHQCVNLDGPGFSETYILAHKSDIEKSKGLIEHYQWSVVGSLLTPVPGCYYQTISAETPEGAGIQNLLFRHDTYNVQYTEEGDFVPGERDPLAVKLSPLSKVLDYSLFTLFTEPLIPFVFDALDKLHDSFENLWDCWQQVRNGNRDTQYVVKMSGINESVEKISECASRLREISSEIERIQRQIAFDSGAAAYVKIKLWSIAGKIEDDEKKWGKYGVIGRECAQRYRNAESKIVGNY